MRRGGPLRNALARAEKAGGSRAQAARVLPAWGHGMRGDGLGGTSFCRPEAGPAAGNPTGPPCRIAGARVWWRKRSLASARAQREPREVCGDPVM